MAPAREWPGGPTRRELLVLISHLEASLLDDDTSDLGAAIAQHEELVHARPAEQRPGDTSRGAELETRPGWRSLRVTRRYEEHERALAPVDSGESELVAAQPQRPVELVPAR